MVALQGNRCRLHLREVLAHASTVVVNQNARAACRAASSIAGAAARPRAASPRSDHNRRHAATALARRDEHGQLVAHVESWSHNPFAKGSYSCNRPGYFTTLADNEAKAVGNLLFAGDHTSSIHEWQGFMEGAALSGLRAAAEVHALARA